MNFYFIFYFAFYFNYLKHWILKNKKFDKWFSYLIGKMIVKRLAGIKTNKRNSKDIGMA